MAENTDVMEITPEDEKESLENSKVFVENVLSTLKNPKIFRRNIGGRKKWADLKNPKKAWAEEKENPKNETKLALKEIVEDLRDYLEKGLEWKKNDSIEKMSKMVEIFDAGLKASWGGDEEERRKKLMNLGKIVKIRQFKVIKKPIIEQKATEQKPLKFYKLGTRLNRAQISSILNDSPIDMRVSGPSRAAKIQATRMINSGAQSQNSDDIQDQLNAHFGIPKHSGLNRGNMASNSPIRRPVSPIFPSEKGQPKGRCPMCDEMINLSRLPTHAALCEGTPMYIPE